MKSTIGVYDNQSEALAAVRLLKDAGFTEKQISLIGKGGEDPGLDAQTFSPEMKVAATGVGIGAVVGPIVGALAGMGLLAIPGLGLIVGAGAVAGAVAGFDIGLIGGGLFSALAIATKSKEYEAEYRKHIEEGRYILVVQGAPEDVSRANDLLTSHGRHHALDAHE